MTTSIGRDLPAGAGHASDQRIRRLSFAQEQLWFLDQLTPGKTTYNILMVWRLRGPLRVDLLRASLNLLVARHESLRVTIHSHEGTPYQVVAPAVEAPLVVTDLRGLPEEQREQRVRAEIEAQRAKPYDLETGPLCRFGLLRLDSEEYVFFQGFHHIITDGWSAAVMNAELATAYRSLHSGAEPEFETRELDYTEYAQAQRERLQGDTLAEELAFWQERLADLPVLDLPADRPRPTGGSHQGRTLIQDFPDDLRDIVRQLADDHGASMFMVLAAGFNLVLSRYSGSEDVPIGVPMLGRPEPELEAVVGMFINMVVLRSDLSGDPSFSDLIERITDANLDLYEHQEVSFNQVVDAVQPDREPGRNPLFQVSLQLLGDSNSGEHLGFPGVSAEFVPLASLESRFDIALNILDTGTSLRAFVEYSSDMFDSWRIEAMLRHLETVLRAAAAGPAVPLSQIPIVAGDEAGQLLAAGRSVEARHAGSGEVRQVYVVDPAMNLVPRGVPGELLVSGEPDSAGDLIADPFQPGRLVCRTGDLARWNADLRLEVLGRLDDQVRLRGLRVDLARVEAALTSHPAVGDAAVVVRPDQDGVEHLVGYVTPATDRTAAPTAPPAPAPAPAELRAHLAGTLPGHMIPTTWMVLAELPLLPDGTVDRAALPDPADSGRGEAEPRTPTEQAVAEIFGEVLAKPEVGAEDNFFEVGGNSLQAMRVVARIKKRFGVKLSVRTLYGNVTVRAVSAVVDEKLGGAPA